MTWHHQIDLTQCRTVAETGPAPGPMTPGLTHTYDQALREQASAHMPPAPPEFMGLQGEYDTIGLVRRLAEALDQIPDLAPIDTLSLSQQGSTLRLTGHLDDSTQLARIVEIACRLDGTRAVDTSQVDKASVLPVGAMVSEA
ncbi:MAG TPA: hypothetical protein VLS96_10380 [Nodosilinea sp.]|nr:hypothetical protein [Nodosilinea sp.]